MRIERTVEANLDLNELQELSRWAAVLGASLEGNELTGQYSYPVPFRVTVAGKPVDNGLEFELVEGDLMVLQGTVTLRAPGHVHWGIDLGFPVTVPHALLTELDEVLVPRWTRALATAAS